MVVSKDIIMDY